MKYFKKAIKNYANFKGCASPKEFWMYILFVWIFLMLLTVVSVGLMDVLRANHVYNTEILLCLPALFMLFCIIPSMAITVRRLHDTRRSGWYYLFILIPYIGSIILLIFCLDKSRINGNPYREIFEDIS